MAHKMKFNKVQSTAMFCHYDRSRYEEHKRKVEHGETVKGYVLPNKKTATNYNLASELQPLPQGEFLEKRLSEVKHINRADIVTSVDWVITLPKDVRPSDERRFFESCFDFCSTRYGEENVISAYVHRDEVTPHLHFSFVPVLRSAEVERLNAKNVVNRRDLQSFHADLSKFVERRLNYHVSILNGATADGNQSIAELKKGTKKMKKDYQKTQKDLVETREERDQAHFEAVKHLETAKVDLSVELPDGAKKVHRGLFKGRKEYVIVKSEDWNSHAATAETAKRISEAVSWYENTPTGQRLKRETSTFNERLKCSEEHRRIAQNRANELGEELGKWQRYAQQQKKEKEQAQQAQKIAQLDYDITRTNFRIYIKTVEEVTSEGQREEIRKRFYEKKEIEKQKKKQEQEQEQARQEQPQNQRQKQNYNSR